MNRQPNPTAPGGANSALHNNDPTMRTLLADQFSGIAIAPEEYEGQTEEILASLYAYRTCLSVREPLANFSQPRNNLLEEG